MNFIEKILQEVYNTDIQFPNSLKNIKPKVQRFFAYGDLNLLKKTSIAVIGSRNCSEYGKKIAKKLTSELVANDIVIVSGMARGIDSVAHETCLEFGGKTIAVLGSGFKNIYPKENTELFYKIIDNGGLVISEFSLEEPVQMKNFPKRNRIISGLSDGVLVVEAAYRSGTSITVRNAITQGKKIFCIPNSIGNKNSYGTIELAKKGAIMVTSAEDILKGIGIVPRQNNKALDIINRKKRHNISFKNESYRSIYNELKVHECMDSEELTAITGINIVLVNQILTDMELDGIIENIKINKYKLKDEYCE